MNLAQCVESIMKSKGITRYKLAKELGVHQTTIKNWFEKNTLTWGTLEKISKILDMPMAELIFQILILEKGIEVEEGVEYRYNLMGSSEEVIEKVSNDYEKLIENYNKLNTLGKGEAIKRVEELTEIPKYTKPDNEE